MRRRPPRGSPPTRYRSQPVAGVATRSQSRSALAGRIASSFAVAIGRIIAVEDAGMGLDDLARGPRTSRHRRTGGSGPRAKSRPGATASGMSAAARPRAGSCRFRARRGRGRARPDRQAPARSNNAPRRRARLSARRRPSLGPARVGPGLGATPCRVEDPDGLRLALERRRRQVHVLEVVRVSPVRSPRPPPALLGRDRLDP